MTEPARLPWRDIEGVPALVPRKRGEKFEADYDESKHPRDDHGRWTHGEGDAPSPWAKPGDVTRAVELASKATAADVAAGKVPHVSMGDPAKVGPMVLAQYQGDGDIHVFPGFFDLSESGRTLLMYHEFGHEVAQRSALTQGWVEPFRPFRLKPDDPWRYDNIAGSSERPEEMIADIYSSAMTMKQPWWGEPGGKYAKAYEHVLSVAAKAGLPLPRWLKK